MEPQQPRDPFVDGLIEYYRMRYRYPLPPGATPDDEFKYLVWRTVFPMVVAIFVLPAVIIMFALDGVGPKSATAIVAVVAAIGCFVANHVCRVVFEGWK